MEVPREMVSESPFEMFYSFKLGQNVVVDETHVRIPFGHLLKGWYRRKRTIPGRQMTESGIVEIRFTPNPVSVFPNTNSGFIEQFMTVTQDGLWTEADEEEMAERQAQNEEFANSAENNSDDREYLYDEPLLMNEYAIGSRASAQLIWMSYDHSQVDLVRKSLQSGKKDNTPYRESLAGDLSSDILEDLERGRTSHDCFHFGKDYVNMNYDEDIVSFPIDQEILGFKSSGDFSMNPSITVNSGRVNFQLNNEKDTLEILFIGYSTGFLDLSNSLATANFFMGPPHVPDDLDGRVNYVTADDVLPLCELTLMKMKDARPTDMKKLWAPLDDVCPENVRNDFRQALQDFNYADFATNFSPAPDDALEAARIATDYLFCVNKWLPLSLWPYSHGYNIIESSVYLHALYETPSESFVDWYTDPNMGIFDVDYVYGKDEPGLVASAHGDPIINTFKGDCYDLHVDGFYLASSHPDFNHNIYVAVYNQFIREIQITDENDLLLWSFSNMNEVTGDWAHELVYEQKMCAEFLWKECEFRFHEYSFDAQVFRYYAQIMHHDYADAALKYGERGVHLDIYPRLYMQTADDFVLQEYKGIYFDNPLPEENLKCPSF